MRARFYLLFFLLTLSSLSWAVSGHITDNVVWNDDQIVTGDLIIDDGAVLTINAGATIYFPKIDNDLDGVGDTRFVVDGRLIINGSVGNDVIFTSLELSPAPSDWAGITFNNSGAIYSVMNYFKVFFAEEGINVNAKYVSMNNATVAYCNTYAIKVNNSYAGLTSISNTILFENTYDGMVATADAKVNGDGVISSSNGRYGFDFNSTTDASFDNSRAIGNTNVGINVTNAVVTFSNSDISENLDSGVYVNGSTADASFDNCSINDNQKMGVFYDSGSTGDVTYSTITRNYYSGVWIQAESAPTVNYCNIYGNATYPETYIFTESIPTNSLYVSSTNGYSGYYTIKYPITMASQVNLSGWMDHYSSTSDYQMWLYDDNSSEIATYSRQNSSYDTSFDSWFSVNTTSSNQRLRLRIYTYYNTGSIPWARCSQIRYDFTSYLTDLACLNQTTVIDAEYNWWGQITGVNELVSQYVNGSVSYTNLQSQEVASAGATVTNIAPQLFLNNPTDLVLNPTDYTFNWLDIDVDDNALISFYYDDGQDFTGTMFAENISENSSIDSYTWDFTNVPHDIYYIYAVIDDGVNTPYMTYAEGRIMVGPLGAGITEDIVGAATETVAIPIFITNSIPEYNILSFQFTVTYDFTLLTAIDVETAGTLCEGWSVNYNTGTIGTIEINGFNTTALQMGGTLLYVNMTVASDANDYDNCQLNFTGFEFNEDTEAVVQHNGLFTVYNNYDIAGTVTYYSGTDPVAGVSINLAGDQEASTPSLADGSYLFDNIATGNYHLIADTDIIIPTLTVTPYDAALTARYALGIDVFTANQILAADVSGNGSASVYDSALMAQYAINLIDEFPAGDWLFSPDSTAVEVFGDDVLANFSAIAIGDPSGNYPGSAERAIEFNSQDIVLNPNSNGEYILSVSSEDEYMSLTGSINFREDVLTYVGIRYASSLENFNSEDVLVNGNLKFSAWNSENVNAGEVMELIFRGNGVDAEIIEVEYFVFDETAGGVFTAPTGNEDNNITPLSFALHGNYPNPFNPETTISFSIQTESNVSIEIFNVKGQKVKTLTNDTYTSGMHSIVWNGSTDLGKKASSGIYFYRLNAGSYSSTRKMALLK